MTQYNEWEQGATNRSVEARLAEVQQRRTEAVEAERARLEAENRHKQEIAQLDAEIKALERQQAEQRFHQAEQDCAVLRGKNEDAAKQLTEALSELVRLVEQKIVPLVHAVDQSFLAQANRRMQAVGPEQAWLVEQLMKGLSSDDVKFKARLELQPQIDAVAEKIPSAYPAWIWVTQWQKRINQRDTLARRAAGLYAALFGAMPLGMDNTFNWQRDINYAFNQGKLPSQMVVPVEGGVKELEETFAAPSSR